MEERNPLEIQDRIQALQEELEERKRALPRHTIRPHQLIAIEELEDKIHALQLQVSRLQQKGNKE